MEKFFDRLFSMRMMALGLLIFLLAIGAATIVETVYDTQSARLWIYSALWFNILLVYLCINLIANIFRYRMYQREKFAMLVFHLAFILIMIGAAVTRFISFEGLMIIPVGQTSNQLYLSDPHVSVYIHDDKMEYSNNVKALMSEVYWNDLDIEEIEFPGHQNPIQIEYVHYQKRLVDSLVIDPKYDGEVLELVSGGRQSNYIGPGQVFMAGDVPVAFEKNLREPGISLFRKDGKIMVKTKLPVTYLRMSEMTKANQTGALIADSMYRKIPSDSAVVFETRCLYQIGNEQLVFNRAVPHARMEKLPSGRKDVGLDRLTLKIVDGDKSRYVHLDGGDDMLPEMVEFEFNGLIYRLGYGSTTQALPFGISCRDFQMKKYPGSEVASSYASEVSIIDTAKKYQRDQRIFMNHVMDYGGYRFFQSSYELDNPQTPQNEEATKLSVNHDFWGTNISYLGYLLMGIGMVMSLLVPGGRFRHLIELIGKSRKRREEMFLSLLLLVCLPWSANAQDSAAVADTHQHDHQHEHHQETPKDEFKPNLTYHFMTEEHSDALASLLVQDMSGRIIPMHTNCDQLLRKIYGANTYEGKNAIQTIVSMHMYPGYWMTQKVIMVPSAVRERLKLEKYASFMDLVDEKVESFRWMDAYNEAHKKLESKRSEFDKKLIKLVERFQVFTSFFGWDYMHIVPIKNMANNTWFAPVSMELQQRNPQMYMQGIQYLNAIHVASEKNTWGQAMDQLNALKKYQRSVAPADILPSEDHVAWEIKYNKMNIFGNAMNSYLYISLVLLVLFFIGVLKQPTLKLNKRLKRISLPFIILAVVVFAYHGFGLGLRWYISGHAPWSNGYEAIIFIAWVTMLASFFFIRRYPIVLAAGAILAYMMIFVSELNLLDPEITPLQPVLKSYWLMIHVAIITGSYGFLGLGAIISIINQIMYMLRNQRNGQYVTMQIHELTWINEIIITVGLFMLTIGTFLGGVWANESWGRYWGWDPKETWALVSVLVYAVILHLRFIPGMKSKFLFNAVTLWGYSAILFTFFGVNFILVGLHSYAQGEGVISLPPIVWILTTIFVIFTTVAAIRNHQYKKLNAASEI